MHCLLIDDNLKTSARLAGLLAKAAGITAVHTAVQPYLVRSLMACEPIDVIFSRVRLWDHRVFGKLDTMPPIVFLCGGRDKLSEQPGTAVPYKLREPYRPFELSQLITRLRAERFTERAAYCFVRYEGRHHRVFFNDIEMIERLRMSYVKLVTRYTTMILNGSLAGWLRLLPENEFVRVSDTLVLPVREESRIHDDEYEHRGRRIRLTYRFRANDRKLAEKHTDWSGSFG